MEPFISRDGKWLFFNSRNAGPDTALHYGLFINSTTVRYMGRIGGAANAPLPHLDAVPAMTDNYEFVWISTRNYAQNYEAVFQGTFDPVYGTIPTATPVHGNFYIREPVWIVMDQELNRDGSILFYVNAHFGFPPGPLPIFSNISLALRNPDGTYSEHPKAAEIMKTVNAADPTILTYAPSSLGTDGLELYYSQGGALFVTRRNSPDEPFGTPELINLPCSGDWTEPEAPTLSSDGKLMIFNRMDCKTVVGCPYINIYKMDRLSKPIV